MERVRRIVDEYLVDSLEDLNSRLQASGLRPTTLQAVNVFDNHPAILFIVGTERVEMGRAVVTFRLMTTSMKTPTEEGVISVPFDVFGYPIEGTHVACAFGDSSVSGTVRHTDGGCWDIQWDLPNRP
ncbi:hypothetical protein ACFLZO_01285 [Patescibacteria group bacterium]